MDWSQLRAQWVFRASLAIGLGVLLLGIAGGPLPSSLAGRPSPVSADEPKKADPVKDCRYALLVAVGFKTPKDVDSGAPTPAQYGTSKSSVEVISGALTDNWGFSPTHIETIMNDSAKKVSVTKALKSLTDKVTAADAKVCK